MLSILVNLMCFHQTRSGVDLIHNIVSEHLIHQRNISFNNIKLLNKILKIDKIKKKVVKKHI